MSIGVILAVPSITLVYRLSISTAKCFSTGVNFNLVPERGEIPGYLLAGKGGAVTTEILHLFLHHASGKLHMASVT